MWKAGIGHKQHVRIGFYLLFGAHGEEHVHGFGSGGGFIEQRGIGDFHAGEVHHHGLVVEQSLQSALRNLGLVRCVGGVPTRIFEDVSKDDRRRNRIVIA